jgi:hypothetical protein
MQNPGQMTKNQVTPGFLIELENEYAALARKEVEARIRASLPVTPEWLNALEGKYQARAWQEIAAIRESACNVRDVGLLVGMFIGERKV